MDSLLNYFDNTYKHTGIIKLNTRTEQENLNQESEFLKSVKVVKV